MQTSLNLSLTRVLHVYGDRAVLRVLADIGIPTLKLTRCVHLAQLHFRVTTTQLDTIHALLFKKLNTPFTLSNLHPTTFDYHIRYIIYELKWTHTHPLPHVASQPSNTMIVPFKI